MRRRAMLLVAVLIVGAGVMPSAGCGQVGSGFGPAGKQKNATPPPDTNQSSATQNPAGRSVDPRIATSLPLDGSETSPLDYYADPIARVDQPMIFAGVIKQDSYYNYNYNEAESTHAAFEFWPTDATVHTIGESPMAIYMVRTRAGGLVDELAEIRKGGNERMAVRVKAVRLRDRHDSHDSGQTLELLDWQRMTKDRKGWGPWQAGS